MEILSAANTGPKLVFGDIRGSGPPSRAEFMENQDYQCEQESDGLALSIYTRTAYSTSGTMAMRWMISILSCYSSDFYDRHM